MKHVLFVAYLFPPIANSGTQRSLKFVKYLPSCGWRPTVLTAASFEGHALDETLLNDVPCETRVVRVPMLNELIAGNMARLMGGGRLGNRVGDAVRWRIRNRLRSPDLYASWRSTAFRAALRVHRQFEADAVFATGYPWTSLLVGCDVAKAISRPLVADFRDLWAGETLFPEHRPPKHKELRLEGQVLKCAKRVVTTSRTMSGRLAVSHRDVDTNKFVTIYNGFDSADMAHVPVSRAPAGKMRIVFTGVWKEGYNPSDLYDAIDSIRQSEPQLLDKIEVVTAGFVPGEAARRGLGQYINELGILSHTDALSLMRSADILYFSHVDEDRQWVIPGKLYEYLASGSAVLALTNPNSETAEIIRNVGGGIAVSPREPDALTRTIRNLILEGLFSVPARNPQELASFDRSQQSKELADVLNSVSCL